MKHMIFIFTMMAISLSSHAAKRKICSSYLVNPLCTICNQSFHLHLLKGKSQSNHDFVMGAFVNCRILDKKKRVYPIRSLRTIRYSLIYNPNYKEQTSNVTLTSTLALINGNEAELNQKKHDRNIAAAWVKHSREDKSVKPLVHKLHHRPEYKLYDLQNDPYELKNLADSPAHKRILTELKEKLHNGLDEQGDVDPMETERKFAVGGTSDSKGRKKKAEKAEQVEPVR